MIIKVTASVEVLTEESMVFLMASYHLLAVALLSAWRRYSLPVFIVIWSRRKRRVRRIKVFLMITNTFVSIRVYKKEESEGKNKSETPKEKGTLNISSNIFRMKCLVLKPVKEQFTQIKSLI